VSLDTLVNVAALAAGGIGLGSGAKARIKASRQIATQEVWREEAEAQKARGDRLEVAVEALTTEISSLKKQIHNLTGVLRAVAPELVKGGLNDDS
jgi:cell division protein FtsB